MKLSAKIILLVLVELTFIGLIGIVTYVQVTAVGSDIDAIAEAEIPLMRMASEISSLHSEQQIALERTLGEVSAHARQADRAEPAGQASATVEPNPAHEEGLAGDEALADDDALADDEALADSDIPHDTDSSDDRAQPEQSAPTQAPTDAGGEDLLESAQELDRLDGKLMNAISRARALAEEHAGRDADTADAGALVGITETLDRLDRRQTAHNTAASGLIEAAASGEVDRSEQLAEQLEVARAGVDQEVDALLDDVQGLAAASIEHAGAERRAAMTMIAIAVAASLLLGLLLGLWLFRGINDSLVKLAGDAQELSTEMLSAVQQQSAALSQTSTAVSETTTTSGELSQTSRSASDRATAVAEVAEKSQRASAEALQAVNRGLDAMHRIRHEVEEIAGTILELSQKNLEIGDITDSVAAIAEQSNLLAVNASIEAAKARSFGKGFSVVAGEVKALSDQSKDATERIRKIVSEIKKSSNAAVMVTEQGAKRVKEGAEVVEEIGRKIEELAEVIDDSAQAATQIKLTSREQLSGIDQITDAMASIDQAANESAAGLEQLERNAQEVHTFSQQLNVIVEGKRV